MPDRARRRMPVARRALLALLALAALASAGAGAAPSIELRRSRPPVERSPDDATLVTLHESRIALKKSKMSRQAFAATRGEYRLACAATGLAAALIAWLVDVLLTTDSPLEMPHTGLSKITGISRPTVQLGLVAAVTIAELVVLYRLTLAYAVRMSTALGLEDRPEVRAAIRSLVQSTALGAPPLATSPEAAVKSRELATRLGLRMVVSSKRSTSALRTLLQTIVSLFTQVQAVLTRASRQVFRGWSGPGNPMGSKVFMRLLTRFLGRELTRVAVPLVAIPFWMLWNVGKAKAVMTECAALTTGPALGVEVLGELLPHRRRMPLAHRVAVVRAVAASIHHNVRRVELPFPGFGYSAAAGSVHPNSAILLEAVESAMGVRQPTLLPDEALDSVPAFQYRVRGRAARRGRS